MCILLRYRHALDFRLISQARVAILDASNTLFPTGKAGGGYGLPSPSIQDSELVLQPIPDFSKIIVDVCKEVSGVVGRTKAAPIDIGVVCEASAVRAVARALHERVSRRLKEVKVKAEPT